jgi:hypothetical protein
VGEGVLVVGGGYVFEGISVVVEVVDDEAFLAGVLVPSHLPQHLGGLAREHRAQDQFNVTTSLHKNTAKNYLNCTLTIGSY